MSSTLCTAFGEYELLLTAQGRICKQCFGYVRSHSQCLFSIFSIVTASFLRISLNPYFHLPMLQMPQTSIHSILPATLTYGQQIDIPSSPVPASAALTITAFSNLFFDAMSLEPVPVRPLKCRSVPRGGSPHQATLIRQQHSNEGEFIHVADQSSSPAPRRHLPHGNLIRNPVNFFLIVIQETPLRASGPDTQLSRFLEVQSSISIPHPQVPEEG